MTNTDATEATALIMGSIVTFSGPDDETGHTPQDEAVIHIEGDEDSEIEVHCPNAPELAALIVRAVNRDTQFEAMVGALEATLCELTACATQLARRGRPCRPGGSVSRAQDLARTLLSTIQASK